MYNILEKVFFGDTLVLKFRNIQFWNDLIIRGVKYMYEQDYIIRMNDEENKIPNNKTYIVDKENKTIKQPYIIRMLNLITANQ